MNTSWEKKLYNFCQGLGMENIDKLMTGTPADFLKVGIVMSERIKGLSGNLHKNSLFNGKANTISQKCLTCFYDGCLRHIGKFKENGCPEWSPIEE